MNENWLLNNNNQTYKYVIHDFSRRVKHLLSSYTCYCSSTFYGFPIRFIALLYCVLLSYTFNGFPIRFIALLYCVLLSYFIVPHLLVPLISLRPPFGGMSCGTIPGGRATLFKWPKQLPNIAQNC